MRVNWLCIIFILVMTSCSVPTPGSLPSHLKIQEEVSEFLPGLAVTSFQNEPVTEWPYNIFRFSYRSQLADWPYGQGLAVWSRSTSRLLWLYLHDGDYPPHTVRWADFDGDSRPDIIVHAGAEDVASSYVFLNRVSSDRFGLSQFALGYNSSTGYAVVLDPEDDGRPELLVPESPVADDLFGPQGSQQEGCSYGADFIDALQPEIAVEYHRVVGRYDHLNVDYGLPDDFSLRLHLLEKVSILRLGDQASWVTEQYPEHLRWRIDMLERLGKDSSSACTERIDVVSAYLRNISDHGETDW